MPDKAEQHPTICKIPTLLAAVWDHAYPGREAAERNAAVRDLRECCLQCRLPPNKPAVLPLGENF